ncbi:MAG: CsgG/HfaB family protein [Gemmatimonadaceae bacterium]
MSSIRSLFAALILAPAALFAQDSTQLGARPSITIGAFEYGTVAAQIASDKSTRKRLEKMGIRDGANFAEALGIGAADLIIEELMKTGSFRVLERRQLDAIRQEQSIQPDSITSASPTRVARARYIIAGSVTRLGFEEKHLGGIAGRLASTTVLYGVGGKKNNTFVNLTARVIDAETGEIVASFTGEGTSSKGWGVTLFGMGGWGLGGGKVGTDNVRETAIGEATAEAAAAIAERIGQLRGSLAAG